MTDLRIVPSGAHVTLTAEHDRAVEHARHARDVVLRADIGGVLASAASMRVMLQGCAEALVRHLHAAFARIWTMQPGGAMLELRASAGAYTQLDGAHARVPVGSLRIGLIARDALPYLTNDVATDPRIEDKTWVAREGMVAFAGHPLMVDGRVVGVMAMFARHALAPETLETLASLAPAVAQGIERKRSEEKLRRSEAYLAEGQRLTHTGSWAWNLATGEIYFSREMFRIYGFPPGDQSPPYDAVLQRAHRDDAPIVHHTLQHAFRTGTEFRLLTRIFVPGEPMKWVETYGHPVRDDDGTLVEFMGTVVDVSERMRSSRRLRRALETRYEAVLAERTRIARDMHDGLLQDLAGIALQLGALLPHLGATPDPIAERLRGILELTERTGREARRALVDMREDTQATAADAVDLVSAVQHAAQRVTAGSALSLDVRVVGPVRLVPPRVRDVAVSIVHEAVTNVVKHAHARTVRVAVAFSRRRLRLAIHDDGRGLTLPAGGIAGHFGLTGMRERAAELGASLGVRTAPGGGTVVRLDVPEHRPIRAGENR